MSEWIEWSGGDLPCHPETIIDVMLRNGEIHIGDTAVDWVWKRTGDIDDIVKYRVHNAPNEDGVWIKCMWDRMPDDASNVLVSDGHGVVCAWWSGSRWKGWEGIDRYDITHWQPLPAPPEVE